MEVQDQAAMGLFPALKSKVLPSQRKAPQALFPPRSGTHPDFRCMPSRAI